MLTALPSLVLFFFEIRKTETASDMSTRKTRSKRKAKAAADSIDVTAAPEAKNEPEKQPAAKTDDAAEKMEATLRTELAPKIEAALRSELKSEIEAALRSELKSEIEAALRQELEPLIRQELQDATQAGETKTPQITFVGATSTRTGNRPHRRTYQG